MGILLRINLRILLVATSANPHFTTGYLLLRHSKYPVALHCTYMNCVFICRTAKHKHDLTIKLSSSLSTVTLFTALSDEPMFVYLLLKLLTAEECLITFANFNARDGSISISSLQSQHYRYRIVTS